MLRGGLRALVVGSLLALAGLTAALLVVQMLAITDESLAARLADHRRELAEPS